MKLPTIEVWFKEKADFWGDSIIELTQNQKTSIPSDENQAKYLLKKKKIFLKKKIYSPSNIFEITYASS